MRLEYFEMIDRVVRFDADAKRIEARSIVPMESPVFEGHFPGHPLVPGVLLTETMAQASGYLVLGLMDFSHMPFLMAVDKARFRTFVEPGTELAIEARLEHEGSGYTVTKAKIAVEGRTICDAELRFKTMPFPDGLDAPMRERARQIGLLTEAV
jgi:3-hydroxyacyl-[acyl-carrier-protein] dehydratase